MNKANKVPDGPRRWFDAWRSAERPVQDDPADLGTAFGLDMSFHACDEAPPATPQAGADAPSLMQRLAGGRKPAG